MCLSKAFGGSPSEWMNMTPLELSFWIEDANHVIEQEKRNGRKDSYGGKNI